MKFNPKSEKEIAEAGLWDKGEYAFEIIDSIEKLSKSGKDMIEVKVKIFNKDGASQQIFDYLLPDVMEFKLRHICEACGLLADYEKGMLEGYRLVGKTGYCKVGVSVDKTGQYPNRNNIVDYLVNKTPTTLDEALGGDECPF